LQIKWIVEWTLWLENLIMTLEYIWVYC
jgi:hypothetical protein